MSDSVDFTLRYIGPEFKKIEAIKALRTLTGLGLKEAKDAIESVYGSISAKTFKAKSWQNSMGGWYTMSTATVSGQLCNFRAAGFEMVTIKPEATPKPVYQELVDLTKRCLDEGELFRAECIIHCLKNMQDC